MTSSWFPFNFNFSFPSLTPPLSIQRRFISFLLKRSLGHLLKPGQLDIDQIDAQIGNGFVEIKDLELDCNAINSFVDGLPVQLRSGAIASVTARIPWPNPFSSTVGLSLSGLQLDFCLSEAPSSSHETQYADELAESVASVAESFVHDELTEGEEAQLRQSVHFEQAASGGIPGAINSTIDQDQETAHKLVNDPEGVSIFARLFENLLARFDFDASESTISLTHKDVTIGLCISRIHYFTRGVVQPEQSSDPENPNSGERRSLEVAGFKLTMQDCDERSLSPPNPVDEQMHSDLAHETSDSELDDETQVAMSQSLISLPPRPLDRPTGPPSPVLSTISSVSASSSMYESALSATGRSQLPCQRPIGSDMPIQTGQSKRTILEVTEPILLHLTTPPVAERNQLGPTDESPGQERDQEQSPQNMKLDISMGIIAILLDARCVHGLLMIASAFSKAMPWSPVTRPDVVEQEATTLDLIDLSLTVKGLVALIFGDYGNGPQERSFISQFYEKPLIPLSTLNGYTRLHVDLVKVTRKAEAIISPHASPTSPQPSLESFASTRPQMPRKCLITLAISDVSVLAFHSQIPSSSGASKSGKPNPSSPILITDRNLAYSYRLPSTQPKLHPARHLHPCADDDKNVTMPSIDIMDWNSEHARGQGASLRHWRTRGATASHYQKTPGSLGAGLVSSVGIPLSPTQAMRNPFTDQARSPKSNVSSAVFARIQQGRAANITSIAVDTLPIHFFVDLGVVHSVSEFLVTALPGTNEEPNTSQAGMHRGQEIEDEIDGELFTQTPIKEKSRLEKLVLEDLDLDLDYRQAGDTTPKRRASPSRRGAKTRRNNYHSSPRFDLRIPLLRVELLVPPPVGRSPRTGPLLLDLHSAHLSTSTLHSPGDPRVPRFSVNEKDDTGFEEWFSDVPASQTTSLEIRRVVLAYAGLGQKAAEAVLSLGPLGDTAAETAHDEHGRPLLFPLILFRSRNMMGEEPRPNAILMRVPSLFVNMNKACLDGLQLWVDGIGQWYEQLAGGQPTGGRPSNQVSRTSSLIGSRYFIQRSGSGSTENELASADDPSTKSEVVVKTCVSEVFIRLEIPMGNGTEDNRLLDISASDVDALVEVKPEGKDETVISLNVVDVNIKERSVAGLHSVLITRPMSINRINNPALKVRFRSVSLPSSIAKESRVRLVLNGLTLNLRSEIEWISDLMSFVKAPPGAFESVIPSERTYVSVDVRDCALRVVPPTRQCAAVISLADVTVSTDLVGDSQEMAFHASVSDLSVFLNDDSLTLTEISALSTGPDAAFWMGQRYALLATVQGLNLQLKHNGKTVPSNSQVSINGMLLKVYLCADTISGIAGFIADVQSIIPVSADAASALPKLPRRAMEVSDSRSSTLLRSLDEQAFRRQPVIGPLPDMIDDDLPKNPEYLDSSFGAAAGLRALDDDEDDDFYPEDQSSSTQSSENIISRHGGETIKMLCSPLEIVESYFETLTPNPLDFAAQHGETSVRVRMQDCDVHLLLYDGYDWDRTKAAIREEVKRVRRRLAKIRQLLANGQAYDPNIDEINSVLFNSVYVGLEQDKEDLEGDALITAIDNELAVDASDVASESSWQSFTPDRKARVEAAKSNLRLNKLDRAKGPSIEFALRGMAIDFDRYLPDANLTSRLLSTVRDLEILDHIKTSTWSTFLTELRSDSRGNIRETDSNMVRVELQMLQPFQGHTEQEARLKAKILPLRLHVDQDALDFLKKFFAFKSGDSASPSDEDEIFFQHVEIFPVDIKLDYKPRRVDYRALKEGRTIELMNFFHFDGSEMTLRHITLKGITGWARMFDTLNDLWTPDVKANQLVDVISGVSPIRSAVNVGSGVADLVLLPIAQYKKDGRIIRGLQKGTTAFMKSTAMEAIKLGARLATGTQVVLEQTENVLGGQFSGPVTAEALQAPPRSGPSDALSDEDDDGASAGELYSKYAEQPTNVKEGVQSAYRTLSQNFKYAGQTILAVPMEVYERSGTEGPARAVIRAVPIAVLKPMIGASEAISKTLLGLHNTLDPQAQIDTETKYKHR
ncbi:uncharacterized protein FOMMEDRAFT_153115 [Fomitiporia mediterranea MF3/22]|uniref:uncharacterized protein n=1 Tax=Fomitiporia mediterranea (strain MF3/22) TaxID=694068 RepID=UPI0004409A28|nr:uncharacterized protein FOMMEDRAFT_153115 [Fomitiporia mediterranea MF3/22]EJD05775.1 hypothetical protein FOMMEDRAFT_153115 [Fomitiporia mediterranea MF3/22]